MTMPLPLMDQATLVGEIVRMVVSRTKAPIEGVGILCCAVALIWLATDRDDGLPPDDAAMVEEFASNLAQAVKDMRGDLANHGTMQ